MCLLTAAKNATLPFGVLITRFFMWNGISRTSNDVTKRIRNPIKKQTLEQYVAHVYEDDEDEEEVVAQGGDHPQGEHRRGSNLPLMPILLVLKSKRNNCMCTLMLGLM